MFLSGSKEVNNFYATYGTFHEYSKNYRIGGRIHGKPVLNGEIITIFGGFEYLSSSSSIKFTNCNLDTIHQIKSMLWILFLFIHQKQTIIIFIHIQSN